MRVLVVEDQAELADDIADGLRDQGIGADVAYDGPTGIEKALMNYRRRRSRDRTPGPAR
jgi:DNA-binding response OmpR family regulator